MSSNKDRSKERTLQLLADHATEGPSLNSAAELSELLALHTQYDESYFEPAAAAIDLAMMPPPSEPPPNGLRDRILLDAARCLDTGKN